MSSNQNSPQNRARRHVVGVLAAIVVTAMGSKAAHALGTKVWRRGGGGGGSSGGNDGQNCLLGGTSIMTVSGEVCVEDLKPGDLVVTASGKVLPVKWIGHQNYRKSGESWQENVTPIRVACHALDQRTPHRDLFLSPNHALYLHGVLIRVKDLVNDRSIAPVAPAGEAVDFYNIVLDTHEIILAEGAAVETHLLRDSNYEHFTNFVDYKRLYPAEQQVDMAPFAPVVGYEGGREHLKALIRMGVSPFVTMRDPVREAHERIAARAEERVG